MSIVLDVEKSAFESMAQSKVDGRRSMVLENSYQLEVLNRSRNEHGALWQLCKVRIGKTSGGIGRCFEMGVETLTTGGVGRWATRKDRMDSKQDFYMSWACQNYDSGGRI